MVPITQKYIRSNQSPFMNKNTHKAFMTRTKLSNRFLREATSNLLTRESKKAISWVNERNECYTNRSATRVKNFDFDNDMSENKEKNNFIPRSTFWKYLFPMPKCI